MRLGSLALVVLCLGSTACKKKTVDALPDEAPVLVAPPAPLPPPVAAAVEDLASAFRRVNFAYDSYTLDATALSALASNAAILIAHPEISIQVQGHCDERGTTDYNLALGQRRAEAVKRALVSSSVPPARVATLTFGEERPLAYGHDETAWAENRRAEFVITAR